MFEELPSMVTQATDVLSFMGNVIAFACVAVASFRRSRCLSGYPLWRSALIATAAGAFWLLWILASLVNRRQIAWEWDQFHGRTRPWPDPRFPEGTSDRSRSRWSART